MVQVIGSLTEIASRYDAIILDQWGVLHDGARPYRYANHVIRRLHDAGYRLAVLSNSGKRAAPNRRRMASTGLPDHLFDIVMSSGEALWNDVATGIVAHRLPFPIERQRGDAEAWSAGLDIQLAAKIEDADAILLIGVPDGSQIEDWHSELEHALARQLPIICSNPDIVSVRTHGARVMQPGALARRYQEMGGQVRYYGKPYLPIFKSLAAALHASDTFLMVGDSMEHDILGAHRAGWDSLFVCGGIHRHHLADRGCEGVAELAESMALPPPTYCIGELQ